MATRVDTLLIDDLDGGEAHETVTFSLDNKSHEIDLSHSNAERLRAVFADVVEAARVVGGDTPKQTRRRRSTTPSDPLAWSSEVREWAKTQGLSVGNRGRISNDVVAAYKARTAAKKTTRTRRKAR